MVRVAVERGGVDDLLLADDDAARLRTAQVLAAGQDGYVGADVLGKPPKVLGRRQLGGGGIMMVKGWAGEVGSAANAPLRAASSVSG